MTTQDLNRLTTLLPGISLAQIAEERLGDFRNWRELATANNLDIFQQLPIGQDIKVPSLEEVESIVSQATSAISTVQSTLGSLEDLDLSSLKNQFGSQPWQLISWVL
jgi:hypothetical protein